MLRSCSSLEGGFDLLQVAVLVEGILYQLVTQAPIAALAPGKFGGQQGNQGNRLIHQAKQSS